MAQITTTTQANPFDYPSAGYMARHPNDDSLWAIIHNSAGGWELYRSADGGTTWTIRGSSLTRANVQEYSRITITKDNWLHWVYRTNESSQDRIYYRRIKALNSGTMGSWSSEVLLASPSNGGVAGAYHTGIDYGHNYDGTTDVTSLLIAVGTQVGGSHGVTIYGVTAPTNTNPASNNAIITGTRQWLSTGTGRVGPSVDKQHLGDALSKGSGAQNMWVAWGRTTLRIVKLAYGSGKWTGPTSPVIAKTSGVGPFESVPARWDGTRFLVAVPNELDTNTVDVWQRNAANTSWDTVQTPTHPTGAIRSWGINYSSDTGNFRVFAVGTSTAVLYYIDYVRATASWTSWTQVTATAVLNVINWGVRPSTWANARHDVYIAHSGTPNTLVSYHQVVSYPPYQPTWNTAGIGYPNGAAANVATALVLDWDFLDADPADVQSAYALRRQIGAGALQYWRAADSTWQSTEQKNTSGTSQVTLASGWGTAGGAAHTYAVKVWDSADTASTYSTSYALLPSQTAAPTITSPGAGATITADSVTLEWTVAEQAAFRVRTTLTSGGAQVHDSGWVTSTATSYTPPVVLADLTGYTLYLSTRNGAGLASAEVSRAVTVDYAEPATPTLVATPLPASGVIRVAITNPAPTGGQPAVSSQDLYRRTVGDTGAGELVATGQASGTTVDDWRAVSGVAYEYQVVTRGVNGTTTASAWTP